MLFENRMSYAACVNNNIKAATKTIVSKNKKELKQNEPLSECILYATPFKEHRFRSYQVSPFVSMSPSCSLSSKDTDSYPLPSVSVTDTPNLFKGEKEEPCSCNISEEQTGYQDMGGSPSSEATSCQNEANGSCNFSIERNTSLDYNESDCLDDILDYIEPSWDWIDFLGEQEHKKALNQKRGFLICRSTQSNHHRRAFEKRRICVTQRQTKHNARLPVALQKKYSRIREQKLLHPHKGRQQERMDIETTIDVVGQTNAFLSRRQSTWVDVEPYNGTMQQQEPSQGVCLDRTEQHHITPLEQLINELQYRDVRPEDYDILLQLDDSVKPRTLAFDRVKLLPNFIIDNSVTCCNSTDWTCAICLSALECSTLHKQLPCGHVFHTHCIEMWLLEYSVLCPLDNIAIVDK